MQRPQNKEEDSISGADVPSLQSILNEGKGQRHLQRGNGK